MFGSEQLSQGNKEVQKWCEHPWSLGLDAVLCLVLRRAVNSHNVGLSFLPVLMLTGMHVPPFCP